MDILDFLIFFMWVFIFAILFSIRRKKYDPVLRSYHKKAFWIKVLGAFAFSIFLLYVSPGDSTTLYYPEGRNIYHLILKDPSNIRMIFEPGEKFDQSLLVYPANVGYFAEESNFMTTRIVAILSFFTFGKYMAINLMFSMISFTGVWRLYRFFYEQYPHLHRQLAISILYLPTFVFWSSGILKDPLCTGAIGWITYSMFIIFYRKISIIKNILIILFFSWLLAILKVYILVSYLPFLILFLILRNLQLVRNPLAKFFLVLFFMSASVVGFLKVSDDFTSTLGKFAGQQTITKTIKSYQTNYASQNDYAQSNFSLGVEFDGSPESLVKMAPAAIVASLFRPFLWESKKISTLFTSIESLLMMLFTLFVLIRVGVIKFIRTIFSEPIILYCMMFALLFSLFVGATTPNFGSLVRYKIPAMPFYLISLFLILEVNGKIKKKTVAEIVPAA